MRGGYFDSLGAGARLWGALPAALMLSALAPALITQASAANCTVVQGTVTLNGGACAIAPDTTLRPNPVAVTANGGQITADGVTIIPAGLRSSTGLSSSGASGAITASNLDLNMTGDGGFAADAEGGSIITLNNGVRISFNSVGNANTGLIASGQGSRIVTNGATLAMPGSGALGGLDELVIAQTGGAVTLNGGSFSLTGAATSEIGWLARDRGTITASNTSLTVSGSGGDTGVLGTSFSPISLNRVTVIMPGSSAGETGLLVNEPFALITGNAVSVSVPSSDGGNGIYATGGSIRLAGNNTVSTGGDHAVAVQASGPFSSITVDQTTISTIGPRSPGVSADGGGSVTLTGGSSVSTSGTLSTGLIAWGDGSSISGNTLTVSTSGAGSPGGVLLDGGNITLTGGSVTTTGAGSPGFVFQGQPLGSLTIDGTAIKSAGDAFAVQGVTAAINLSNTTVTSGSGVLLSAAQAGISPATVAFVANNATLRGAIVADAASSSRVSLQNNTIWTVTGNSNVTTLTNDPSLIQFLPPTGNPQSAASYKTLTVTNYVGEGGSILLNTFQHDDSSPSDRLVINGGTATGATTLLIHNTAGHIGALTTGNGIEVVSATNGGMTAPHAFALGNIVAAGPYQYLLFHGGLTRETEHNWYLRNETGPISPEPPHFPDNTLPPNPPIGPDNALPVTPPGATAPPGTTPPGTSPQPPAGGRPFYRMEAPLYSKISLLARQVSLLMLGTFHERQGDQSVLKNDEGGAWVRLIGVGLSQKFSGPLEPSFTGVVGGAQVGSDAYAWDNRSNRVGGFVSYAHAAGTVRGDILDIRNQLGGNLPEDVITGGGYFTHIGDNGWYVDAVLMGSWYNAYPMSERGIGTHTTGSGITASLEGDYPWVLDEEWTLESMGQIIFTSLSFGSASDPFTTLDFLPGDAWYGRVGGRLEHNTTLGGRPTKPFFELNFWHGFGSTDTTVYNANIPIAIPYGNTDIEAAIGVTSQVDESFSLGARLGYLTSIEGNYQRAYKGQLDLRYAW